MSGRGHLQHRYGSLKDLLGSFIAGVHIYADFFTLFYGCMQCWTLYTFYLIIASFYIPWAAVTSEFLMYGMKLNSYVISNYSFCI